MNCIWIWFSNRFRFGTPYVSILLSEVANFKIVFSPLASTTTLRPVCVWDQGRGLF